MSHEIGITRTVYPTVYLSRIVHHFLFKFKDTETDYILVNGMI